MHAEAVAQKTRIAKLEKEMRVKDQRIAELLDDNRRLRLQKLGLGVDQPNFPQTSIRPRGADRNILVSSLTPDPGTGLVGPFEPRPDN